MRALSVAAVLVALVWPAGAAMAAEPAGRGVSGAFRLQDQVEAVRVDRRPPADPVGGFQLSFLGGVQLRGSASGQFGVAIAYLKPSTAAVGVELEGTFTRGPNGKVYYGLLSLLLQSGVRTTRTVPYLAVGVGAYRAVEEIRDNIRDLLPQFGIDTNAASESGVLVGFGFGVRYYLSPSVSFRADYREYRAVTSAEGNLFDRLFSLRRIGGFLSFDF